MDTGKHTAPRDRDHEQIRRRDDAADATRRARACRECGGLGRFWWGAQDHGECGACRGTGRRV
jgi:DnaJ-class molecular chaperone